MRIKAEGSKYSLNLRVGPWDPDRFDGQGDFRFGFDAEVRRAERRFGYEDGMIAEVSMGAIGSHSPEDGRIRAASYMAAIRIAEALNAAGDGFSNEAAAFVLNGARDQSIENLIEVIARFDTQEETA